jgi:hypothetical protein
MRQIFHACLLGIRLISSTANNPTTVLHSMNVFDSSLMNAAFSLMYVDPGMQHKRNSALTAEFFPVASQAQG